MPTALTDRMKKDQRIVALLQAGDRQGMQLAYQQYAKVLYGYIIKVVGSEPMAEEVLQDTFVKIWKNAATYDPAKSQFFTWIVNIAKYTAIDLTRSASFKKSKKTDQLESLVSIDKQNSIDLSIADPGLQKVIGQLDEKYRLMIDLTFFKGYTQREIAKEFDIPLGTVKTRYRAAINELRTKLSKEQLMSLLWYYIMITKL